MRNTKLLVVVDTQVDFVMTDGRSSLPAFAS